MTGKFDADGAIKDMVDFIPIKDDSSESYSAYMEYLRGLMMRMYFTPKERLGLAATSLTIDEPKVMKCWSCGNPMERHDDMAAWWCDAPKCQQYRYTDRDAFKDGKL